MKSRQGLVSMVILNWNGLDFTKKCIDSVRKKTGYAPYEIIVVDNGSSGKEVIELKKMHRKGLVDKLILNESNNGFSGGNNQGIRAGSGEYFLLLNNDTEVEENWLSSLVKAAEKSREIGIVGPNIVSPHEPGTVFGGGFVDDAGIARHSFNPEESEAEQVGGAALLFKRSVLEKIGGLDEGFNPIYFEETDFCERAHRAGYRVVFVPESTVIHFEGGIIEKQPSKWQYMAMNKNRQRYMLLHFSLRRLLKAIPWEILRIGKNLVNLRLHWLLQSYWITLKNLRDIMRRKSRYNKGKLHAVKGRGKTVQNIKIGNKEIGQGAEKRVNRKTVLAVITARGDSKRVKDKNIKKINGKPLIAYTIEEALLSESLNKVVVSTDSEKIAAVSKKFGVDVPFMRPESLAQDESSSADATRHAVEEVESLEGKKADCVVLLQPTSPFRKAWHINKAVEKFLEEKANSLFSVSKPSKESRFLVYLENGKMQFAGSGKQKGKELFNLNGAIFIHDRKTLFSGGKYPIGKKCVLFEMPERNSVDIDTEEDFLKAEKLAKRLEKK